MVNVEPCSVKRCGNYSIDGIDGRCDYHLQPETREFVITATIEYVVEARDEDEAIENFELELDKTQFDCNNVDVQEEGT